jgi:hypothetical protein
MPLRTVNIGFSNTRPRGGVIQYFAQYPKIWTRKFACFGWPGKGGEDNAMSDQNPLFRVASFLKPDLDAAAQHSPLGV